MAGKYTPLENYLRDLPESQKEVTLAFEQIERILNDKLPSSAYEYQAWWANEKEGNHVNARSWSNAGWKVDEVNFKEKWVKLVRAATAGRGAQGRVVMSNFQPNNPLHGITLEMILIRLVERYGWEEMGWRITVKCFTVEPSIKSRLKFLRRTPWVRKKVEALYLLCPFKGRGQCPTRGCNACGD